MENKGLTNRISWIDFLKGICIICMVFAHRLNVSTGVVPNFISILIYSFHMPLLFFLSGITFSVEKYKNFNEFIIKKAKSLLIPLFCFSVIKLMFQFFYYNLLLNNDDFSLDIMFGRLLGIAFQSRTGNFQSFYWFLSCLFVSELLMYGIVKITNNNLKRIFLLIIVIFIFGLIWIRIICEIPVWSIDLCSVSLLFIGVGYILKEINYNPVKKIQRKYSVLLLLINIIITYFNAKHMNFTKIDMVKYQIGNEILFVIQTIAGISFFIILFYKTEGKKTINYIGKNSLMYYMLCDMLMFIPDIFVYNIFNINLVELGNYSVMEAVISTIMVFFIMYPISLLINKRMKFLLGKC